MGRRRQFGSGKEAVEADLSTTKQKPDVPDTGTGSIVTL